MNDRRVDHRLLLPAGPVDPAEVRRTQTGRSASPRWAAAGWAFEARAGRPLRAHRAAGAAAGRRRRWRCGGCRSASGWSWRSRRSCRGGRRRRRGCGCRAGPRQAPPLAWARAPAAAGAWARAGRATLTAPASVSSMGAHEQPTLGIRFIGGTPPGRGEGQRKASTSDGGGRSKAVYVAARRVFVLRRRRLASSDCR